MRRHAKFDRNRSKYGGDMAIFRFFNMAAAATLVFQNFKFLMVGWLKRVEMRRCAKFGRNRSKCDRDMTIFRFFQDGGRPPSWICDACFRTTHEVHLLVFITMQNLVEIDTVVSITCKFYYFVT